MAGTKSKLTLSVDAELIKRLHAFVNENPGHPTISGLFEQMMVAYVDHFGPVLDRARAGDAEASIAMLESAIFRVTTPLGQMMNDVSNIRRDWEEEKKKKTTKLVKKTKKKSA